MILMEPPDPFVAGPLATVIGPLLPPLAGPEDNKIEPEFPAEEAGPVTRLINPEPDDTLEPLETKTAPPKEVVAEYPPTNCTNPPLACVAKPAAINTSPPTPDRLVPITIDMDPARPPVASPEDNKMCPEFPA